MGALKTGAGIGAGAVVTQIGTGFISKHLPAQLQTGIGNTAVKAAVGLVALPMLLKIVPGGSKFARPVMIGAGVIVLFDLFNTYLKAPIDKALGLAGYETGVLSGYETGVLEGYITPGDSSVDAVLSGTVYEGSIYD